MTRATLAEAAFRRKAARSRNGRTVPRLVLMTDRERLPDPVAAAARLPPGSAVVLRDRGWSGRIELGRRLRAICRAKRILFLVAGDEGLAVRLAADGVHWPERSVRARRERRRWRLVTAAAHGKAGIVRARRMGADAVLLSPVFPTASHPNAPALGPVRFAALAAAARIPAIALGGLTARTLRRLGGTGVAGAAAIGALAI